MLEQLQQILENIQDAKEKAFNDQYFEDLEELEFDVEEMIVYLGGDLDTSDWKVDDRDFTREDAIETDLEPLLERASRLEVL